MEPSPQSFWDSSRTLRKDSESYFFPYFSRA